MPSDQLSTLFLELLPSLKQLQQSLSRDNLTGTLTL